MVVDRPASLRIIKGAGLLGKIGLISHANTTPEFQRLFREYPCGAIPCQATDPFNGMQCSSEDSLGTCTLAITLRERTVKICDCGMFTKDGVQLSYRDLFNRYDDMGTDYGIMIDVFRNPVATLASAKRGPFNLW